jgi:hypothetical protein
MEIDKLNRWLTLAANIGVIAGILFLAVELQQNNELMAAQDRYNRYEVATRTFDFLISDESINNIYFRAMASDQLTASEMKRFRSLAALTIFGFEWSYKEIPVEELPVERWLRNFESENFIDVWNFWKSSMDPEFVAFIESHYNPPRN